MAYNILYPLGNSDLQVCIDGKVQRLDMRHCSFRDVSERLLKFVEDGRFEVKDGIGKLEFEEAIDVGKGEKVSRWYLPLFGKAWKYVTEKGGGVEKCNRIFLFATDQGKNGNQDTIYLAYILKKVLIKRCKVDEGVISIDIIQGNPSDSDEMSKFFGDFVSKRERELRYAKNYVFVGPGTPAINTTLSVSMADFSTEYLYLKREGTSTEVVPLDFFKRLSRRKYAVMLEKLVDSYEYAAVAEVIGGTPFSSDSTLERVLLAMADRRNYNFDHPYEVANTLPEDSEEREVLIDYFSDIINGKRSQLCAIYDDMCIYLSRKEYHAAMAMLFSFTDVLSNEVFELLYGIGLKGKDVQKRFKEFISSNDELRKYLEEKRIKYDSLNRLCIDALVSRAIGDKDRSKFNNLQNKTLTLWSDLKEIENDIEGLREVRNKGPFAHGYRGVSEDTKDLLEKVVVRIGEMITNLCGRESFYERVNELIKRRLEV